MFEKYFVYSVVFFYVFSGVLKYSNQEKKQQKRGNSLHNVNLINELLSFIACS